MLLFLPSGAPYFLWDTLDSKVMHSDGFADFMPDGSDGKESACSVGDLGLIPGSGRSVGEGNGYLLQHSCLENPMGRGVWQAIYSPLGHKESDIRVTNTFTYQMW